MEGDRKSQSKVEREKEEDREERSTHAAASDGYACYIRSCLMMLIRKLTPRRCRR